MKRIVQIVSVLAITLWLACFTSVQAAIWNVAARSEWIAEANVLGGFALALSILAWIGWAILPPPSAPPSPPQ